MEFYERLRSIRLQRGMTQRDLAERIGISVVSIGCWESGTKNPSMVAVVALAKALRVSTDCLLGVVSDMEDIRLDRREWELLSKYRLLDSFGRHTVDVVCAAERNRVIHSERERERLGTPVIGRKPSRYIPRYSTPSAAGYSVPLDGDDFEMIPVSDDMPHEADFAVCIQGNSMLPYVQDGDTVFVQRDVELTIGDIGIFCVDGAMYCKHYFLDADRNLILVSANPDYRHTNVRVAADSGDSVKCLGKVLLDQKPELPAYLFE